MVRRGYSGELEILVGNGGGFGYKGLDDMAELMDSLTTNVLKPKQKQTGNKEYTISLSNMSDKDKHQYDIVCYSRVGYLPKDNNPNTPKPN